MPFGRTELSIRASCRKFSALSSREGPVGPGIQGIPEKFDFHDFSGPLFTNKNMKMVDEDGWIWNLGLRMIPNDRARLGRGPWGISANKSQNFNEKSISFAWSIADFLYSFPTFGPPAKEFLHYPEPERGCKIRTPATISRSRQ